MAVPKFYFDILVSSALFKIGSSGACAFVMNDKYVFGCVSIGLASLVGYCANKYTKSGNNGLFRVNDSSFCGKNVPTSGSRADVNHKRTHRRRSFN